MDLKSIFMNSRQLADPQQPHWALASDMRRAHVAETSKGPSVQIMRESDMAAYT